MIPEKLMKLRQMIENAAEAQKKELAWVGNLYKQRLKDLQEMEVKRQAWLKKQQKDDELT
jgi:hypothetical protein